MKKIKKNNKGLISKKIKKCGNRIKYIFNQFRTNPKEAFKKDAIYSLDKNWIEKNIYDYLYLNKECDKVFISKNDSILPF